MLTGFDFILIFQSATMLIAIFIIIHPVLSENVTPISLVYLAIGLLILQLANQLEFVLFEEFIVNSQTSKLIYWGPVIEELIKGLTIIYISLRPTDEQKSILLTGFLVGFGFAIGELIGYSLLLGTSTLITRTTIIIFGHPFYGFVMAYCIFRLKLKEYHYIVSFVVMIALIASMVMAHVLWNLISVYYTVYLIVLISFTILIWGFLLYKLSELSMQPNNSL